MALLNLKVKKMKKLAIVSLFIFVSLILFSCNTNTIYELTPIYAFDTVVSIKLQKNNDEYTLTKEQAEIHYRVIKSVLDDITLSTNDFESNEYNNGLYDLNKERELAVDYYLVNILEYSVKLIDDTDGYFNPFLGRLNHIWKQSIKEKKVPSDDVIKKELEIAKNTSLKIEEDKVTIVGDGNIDLGGVVKGYALEWIKDYLIGQKITKFVIDCGSSSVYIGDMEATIYITKPYSGGYIEKLTLKNKGVATSNGKYQNIVIDDNRYHHLLNPYTGYPSNYYESISVMGNIDNGLLDAYSTAMFSMNEEKIREFCKAKGLEAILYMNDETKIKIA